MRYYYHQSLASLAPYILQIRHALRVQSHVAALLRLSVNGSSARSLNFIIDFIAQRIPLAQMVFVSFRSFFIYPCWNRFSSLSSVLPPSFIYGSASLHPILKEGVNPPLTSMRPVWGAKRPLRSLLRDGLTTSRLTAQTESKGSLRQVGICLPRKHPAR